MAKKKEIAKTSQVDDDFAYSRAVYYDLIAKGQDAIERGIEIVEESGHPRALEVLLDGISKTAIINDKLMEHHRKKQKIDMDNGNFNVNDAKEKGFVGSIADLQKALLAQMEKAEEEQNAQVIDVTPEKEEEK